MLPNKPLSNFELEDAAKRLKIPCFRGVFLPDTLPKKLNKKECGIVNFDKSGGPGTHWVAWYKNGKTKIYFDSYGVQPPIEVSGKSNILQKKKKKIVMQCITEAAMFWTTISEIFPLH